MFSDISLLIKTFERKVALRTFLTSIRNMGYGSCPILIADDSRTPYRDEILAEFGDIVNNYLVLPFDSGLSKGRNELLKRVETEYFVINDDDFIYDPRTDLAWMHRQLETTDIELLGGLFYDQISYVPPPNASIPRRAWYRLLRTTGIERERVRRYHGNLETENGTLLMRPIDATTPVTRCDYTHNFFMADTEAVRVKVGGWDEELKVRGHWEFFYRAKRAGLRVATTERVGIAHRSAGSSQHYKKFRKERGDQFEQMALRRHGFRRKRWLATALEVPEWREFVV